MTEPSDEHPRERGPIDALNDLTGGALLEVLQSLTELLRTATAPAHIGEGEDPSGQPAEDALRPGEGPGH